MKRVYVVGVGEVGRRLAGALERDGWQVARVTRRRGWPAAADHRDPSPRIVAVREEALAGVLARLPADLRVRVVLVQNGFLEAVHDDLGETTRGLIWFTSKGAFFRSLRPSVFRGAWAEPLVAALDRGGIDVVRIDDRDRFAREMILKGIWNCVVGLPLVAHDVDLATYLREWHDELVDLVAECATAAAAHYGVSVDPRAALDRIEETTTELGWMRGGAKALAWRNGAIVTFGRRHGIPTPVNDRLLRAATGTTPGGG
ncbi:MAG TPA: hypothetical protein VD788_06395 [Candidatus Polarisedimenticolaceae bacterium]|nr:hypothetical protein [Candidatus Polarisedimenticolaceae bacterium]